MSIILLYIYKLLCFTKNLIFKKLITIILFFIFVLTLFSSFNDKYPEPLYYTIDFNDGVIHSWSRKMMFDFGGDVAETHTAVNKKFDGMSEDEITFLWSKRNYLDSRKGFRNKTDRKMDSILWICHENYKPSLDKYCVYR